MLKETLDSAKLQILLSEHDPVLIRQDRVMQAAKELIKAIRLIELYPEHQALVDRFEPLRKSNPSLYAHRTFYIWQLSQAGLQLLSLKLPNTEFLKSNSLKCYVSFLGILLDDICDLGRDKTVLDQCILALKGNINPENIELYQLIADTWAMIENEMKQTPNYEFVKPAFNDAYQKWIDSLEYCIWLGEAPRFEEKWEKRLEVIAQTSLIYLVGIIDLSFIPNLSAQQLSSAIQVFLRTQKMVQLSNWTTTWERELAQRDFTSGIFSIALENGWVDWDSLMNEAPEKVAEKIRSSPAESYLWNEWERLRVESLQFVQQAQLLSLDGYVDGFSAFMYLELAHTGLH